MKTPEERKDFLQKLLLAASDADDLLTSCDASDLLDGLEVSRDFMFEAACLIEQLESRLAQIERERDAAVYDLISVRDCTTCKKFNSHKNCSFLIPCVYGGKKHFEWRGLCAQNTKEVGV